MSGRAAAEHWVSLPDTQVYGLSRRSAPVPAGIQGARAGFHDCVRHRGYLQNLGRTVQELKIINEALQAENLERKQAEEALSKAQAELAHVTRVPRDSMVDARDEQKRGWSSSDTPTKGICACVPVSSVSRRPVWLNVVDD